MKPAFYLVFVVSLFLSLISPALAEKSVQSFAPEMVQKLRSSGASYRTEGRAAQVLMPLNIENGERTYRLEPHDIRSHDYKASQVTSSGVQADPGKVFLFKDDSNPEEFLRLALIETPEGEARVRGFTRKKGKYFSLESAEGNSSELEVVEMDEEQVQGMLRECGVQSRVSASAPATASVDFIGGTGGSGSSGDLRELDIATEADFEYNQLFAGAGGANAEILAILNSVDAIYRNQLNIRLRVTFQNTWTTPADPYTSFNAVVLLDQFLEYWNENFSSNNFDVATLYTGRNLIGSTAGIAFLSAACTSFSYNLVQARERSLAVPVSAHEIAHNLGADHDVCGFDSPFIMCPSLINPVDTFSSGSMAQIESFLNFASCISTVNEGGGSSGGGPGLNPDTGGDSGGDGGEPGGDSGDDPAGNPGGGGSASPEAPVIDNILAQIVVENSTLSFSVTASDPDSLSIAITALSLPPGATFSNGQFSWTPGLGTVVGQSSAVFTAEFLATDTLGLTGQGSVSITVSNLNREPEFPNFSIPTLREGELTTFSLAATDPDGDPLTYFTTPLPLGASINSETGEISWMPFRGQAGTYQLRVEADDIFSGNARANFEIVVSPVPGSPELPASSSRGDLDGDGRSELLLHRPLNSEGISAQVDGTALQFFQLATPDEVPLTGDFDGDGYADVARYNPRDRSWLLFFSKTEATTRIVLGGRGGLPLTGDFDGDGRDEVALFDGEQFTYRSSAPGILEKRFIRESLGQTGDIPVPCDYNGDGQEDLAVFTPESGVWTNRNSGSTQDSLVQLGLFEDIPVPGDFNGDGSCERAVWRPATGQWFVEGEQPFQLGLGGDIPIVLDYNGDGRDDKVVFRPPTGQWFMENGQAVQFGLPSDFPLYASSLFYSMRNTNEVSWDDLASNRTVASIFSAFFATVTDVGSFGTTFAPMGAPAGSQIVSGDYDGDGVFDDALFQGGVWTINLASGLVDFRFWGQQGDFPVSGDFDGDGITDLAVWRPADGGWYVIRSRNNAFAFYSWGLSGDVPVPADFNGDGWTDPAVWRPASGTWFVMDGRSSNPTQVVQWGLPGDIPRSADYDRDGRSDFVVWRPAGGFWFTRNSSGDFDFAQWGLPGDEPVPGRFVSPNQTDFAVYRPSDGNVYVRSKASEVRIFNSGVPGGELVQSSGSN